MKLDIPFYANTKDNTHCFQAALKMVLKYFKPEENFTFEQLDKVTAKVEGLWTWPMAGSIWMQENGFEVVDVEEFDHDKFANEGISYMEKEFGKEVADAQEKHSDIEQEQRFSKIFLEKVAVQKRIPVLEDLRKFLKKGYLIICNVNSKALKEIQGYSGHAVVIIGFDESNFFIHNPGLPAIENQKVSFKLFEKAWAYPNENAKNILAFKLKNKP